MVTFFGEWKTTPIGDFPGTTVTTIGSPRPFCFCGFKEQSGLAKLKKFYHKYCNKLKLFMIDKEIYFDNDQK